MEHLSRQRWFIVIAVCMWVALFDFGLQTTHGTLFEAMLDYYKSDRKTTAAVAGVYIAVNHGCGFVVGILIHRFGIMEIPCVGSILISLGFFICFFATSITHVMVCFGVITAFGVAMMYVCSIDMIFKVCTGSYKKLLPLCLSLHSSCITVAGFTLPHLINYLNKCFSLSGTFLLLSGFLANNICVSVLFYFVNKQSQTPTRNQDDECSLRNNNLSETARKISESISVIKVESYDIVENGDSLKTVIPNVKDMPRLAINNTLNFENQTADRSNNTHNSNIKSNESIKQMDAFSETPQQRLIHLSPTITNNDMIRPNVSMFTVKHCSQVNTGKGNTCSTSTLHRKGDNEVIRNICHEMETTDVTDLNSDSKCVSFDKGPHSIDDHVSKESCKLYQSKKPTFEQTSLKKMMFGHVSASFLCFLVATTIVLATENAYLTVFVDIMVSKGYSKDMSLNANIPLNAGALICNLIPGIITIVDPIWFVVFSSLCGTIGQLILLTSSNYAVCMTAVGLTGMTIGGVVSASTIVIANTFGQERFAIAFGQILTSVGLMSAVLAPTYGAIRDLTESYDAVILTTAIAQGLGAFLCGFGWKITNYITHKCEETHF